MMILQNHRHDLPAVGTIDVQKDRLIVRFNRPITRSEFFETFGNVGVIFKDVKKTDREFIQTAEIVEFSLRK